jgi:hypothetical protein
MAETQLKILDAASVTTFVQVFGLAAGTVVMQSIPTNTAGNAMLGSTTGANAMPVVIASDQANLTTVLGAALPAGTNAIGTVTALLPAGTNAIGTVSAIQSGNWVIAAGTNAIGTVSAIQVGSPWGANITQIGGASLALGAAASAASIPVVIANNQTAISVSGTFTATIASTPLNLVTVSATSGSPAATNIKSAATTYINAISLSSNATSYNVYLKLYNVSAAAVNSSVNPVWTVGVNPGDHFTQSLPGGGMTISNACSYIVTRLVANNDTTAVANYDVVGAIGYL